MYLFTKAIDPTRPVVSNDGWQQVMTDAKIFDMVKDKMTHPEYLDQMLAIGAK